MNRADYLGRTYLIPDQTQESTGGRQIRQPSAPQLRPQDLGGYFGLDKLQTEGLQYTDQVGNASREYMKRKAALEQFAKQQWLVYNNDVTAPDPSREDSVLAAQTFQQEIANLMVIGDELKQSQDMFKSMQGPIAQNQFNSFYTGSQPYAQIAGTDAAGYSQQLPEVFDLAKSNINRAVDTRGEFNRLQGEQQQFAQPYNQTAAADPNDPSAQYLKAAADQLSPTYNAPTQPAPATSKDYVRPFIERVVSHKHGGGNWQNSSYTDASGSQYLESDDFKDKPVGTKIIQDAKSGKEQQVDLVVEKSVRNPVTGETLLVFKNKSVAPQRIDNMSSNQLLEMGLIPRQFLDEAYKYIAETKTTDPSGNLIDEMYLSPQVFNKAAQTKAELAPISEQAQARTQATLGAIDSTTGQSKIPGLGWLVGTKTYSSFSPVLNAEVVIKKNSDGTFNVDNIDEVVTKEQFPDAGSYKEYLKAFKNVKKEQLPAILRGFGIEQQLPTEEVKVINKGGKKAY